MTADSRELRELLEQLRDELRVDANPDRQARVLLVPNRYGWTAEPYHPDAFRLWDQLARHADSGPSTRVTSLHHLAIMYHARAFDRELSDRPGSADPDWRQALELWHRLWDTPLFWDELAASADPDAVAAAREALPERLLQVHFDIALDGETPDGRKREHVRLALESPFGAEVKQRVRLRAYERAVSGLDPVTWQPHTLDEVVLERAVQAVGDHLAIDGTCTAALTDLLSVLGRLTQAYVVKANAAQDESDDYRDSILRIRELARDYGPRIEGLSTSDPAEQEQLIRWYKIAGQVAGLLGEHDLAESYRERRAAAQGDRA